MQPHAFLSWTRAVAPLLVFAKTSFAPWPLRLITPEPAAFLPSTNRRPRAWSGMQGRVISCVCVRVVSASLFFVCAALARLRNTSHLDIQGRVGLVCVREIGTWFAMACAFLPLCQRCFPQAPQVGGGDSGEELEDKPQESASSDTEPEEPAGPAGINAVGPQHIVCA